MRIYSHTVKELKEMQKRPYYNTICSQNVGTGHQPCVLQLVGDRQCPYRPNAASGDKKISMGAKHTQKNKAGYKVMVLGKGCLWNVEENGMVRLLRKHEKPGHFDSQ